MFCFLYKMASYELRISDLITDVCSSELIEAASYVMTHTTNPLLSSVAIAGAIADYQAAVGEGRADSLFTVNKVQTRFYRGDGSAVNHDPGNLVRTQDDRKSVV